MRKIEISDRALAEVSRIESYIFRNFGEIVSVEYLQALREKLNGITINPDTYPVYKTRRIGREIRRAVLRRRTIILFEVFENKIRIIRIMDARSNWP